MNEFLIESIGAGISPLVIILFLFLILIIVLIVMLVQLKGNLRRLEQRYNSFMRGESAASLEDDINWIYRDNQSLKKQMQEEHNYIDDIYYRLETMIQKVGIIKYDAFNQMGGKLSYALVLLNEQNTGFVLNSVHSVDGCYTYVKSIKRGKSDVDLGREEQIALERALGNQDSPEA